MLDIPCADDGVLVGADLEQICRLCLQMDDLMICIYDRLDPNPKKRPLCERIYELYQIEVSAKVYTHRLNPIDYGWRTHARECGLIGAREVCVVYIQP